MTLATISAFVQGILQSQLLDAEQREQVSRLQETMPDARALAQELLRRDWLTAYQINQIFQGKGAGLSFGSYIFLERLGEGGMGQVFKARHKMLNRVVALKVIRKECLDNPKVIQRFRREIEMAGKLCHPHIVRAYTANEINGTYYFDMELIEGIDLAKLMKEGGPLKVEQACEYIRQAALGLQHAHERGLVHRDIKPANLLVTRAVNSDRRRSSGCIKRPDLDAKKSGNIPRPELEYPWGIIKILDMGLARYSDPLTGQSATHLTQIGTVMGTPEFIAPEQARDSHQIDIRADLYSLGCTLYFLLAGQPPFPRGSLTEKLLHHQFDQPEPLNDVRRQKLRARQEQHPDTNIPAAMLHVPEQVVQLIGQLMAKRPEDRLQTPQDLANVLQTLLKQMADGTLPNVETETETESAPQTIQLAASAVPIAAFADVELLAENTATVVQPLVYVGPSRPHMSRSLVKVALVLSVLGGCGFLALLVLIAVLLSRGNRTQAGPPAPDVANVRDGDTSLWKHLLRKAVNKRGTWEEGRYEMLRQRDQMPAGAQQQEIDYWLAQIPGPFDELERAKVSPDFPSFLPLDVIGSYGILKKGQDRPVTSVAISPHGQWLVTNEDRGISIFDVAKPSISHKLPVPQTDIVALSPDNRILASAGEDGQIRVWDMQSRSRLFTLDKHKKGVAQLAFHPDGLIFASAAKDGGIRFWDVKTGSETGKIDQPGGEILSLAFSLDGHTIFWGNPQGVRWSPVKDAGKVSAESSLTKFASCRILIFQPRGNLVLAGNGGALHVCTWNGSKLVEKTTLKDQLQKQQIFQAAFAPDGKSFVTVGNGPSAVLWDAVTLTPQKKWGDLRTAGYSVAFSPDGRHFVLGAANNHAFVIRLANYDLDKIKQALD